jgi:hypothetical protein
VSLEEETYNGNTGISTLEYQDEYFGYYDGAVTDLTELFQNTPDFLSDLADLEVIDDDAYLVNFRLGPKYRPAIAMRGLAGEA